jgi:hypothetical protein
MEEEKTQITQMPRKLWNGALKMVKGDNTTQLIEQFTAEMTLVAEGLCEDQSKLRAETDRLITEKDRQIQKLESRVDLRENALEEERAQRDRELTENRNRMAALERQAAQSEKKEKKSGKRNIIKDLTILVAIAAGAWVIVTILQTVFK